MEDPKLKVQCGMNEKLEDVLCRIRIGGDGDRFLRGHVLKYRRPPWVMLASGRGFIVGICQVHAANCCSKHCTSASEIQRDEFGQRAHEMNGQYEGGGELPREQAREDEYRDILAEC